MKILVVDDSSSGADLVATLRQKRDVEVATANPLYAISANEDGSISDPWALALLRECSQEKFDLVVPGSEVPRVLFLGICLDFYYCLWRVLLPKLGFHLDRGSVSQALVEPCLVPP